MSHPVADYHGCVEDAFVLLQDNFDSVAGPQEQPTTTDDIIGRPVDMASVQFESRLTGNDCGSVAQGASWPEGQLRGPPGRRLGASKIAQEGISEETLPGCHSPEER
jgi:hypothetical protein